MQTCPSCGDLVPNEYVLCVWCGFDLTLEKIRKAGITIDNRDALARMVRVVTKPPSTFKDISLLPDNRVRLLPGEPVNFYLSINKK